MPEEATQTIGPGGCFSTARPRRKSSARHIDYHRRDHPRPHWGIVPEPYLSPLHVVNLLMLEFDKPLVSSPEAAAAVQKVTHYYTQLSQPSLTDARARGGRVGRTHQHAGSKRHTLRSDEDNEYAAVAHKGGGVTVGDALQHHSQPGSPVDDLTGYTNRPSGFSSSAPGDESTLFDAQLHRSALSSDLLTPAPTTLSTSIQDALLLDVVGELCSARHLQLTRVTTWARRRLHRQFGPSDVIPHRRALIIADRREPLFTLVLALDRKQPAPAVFSYVADVTSADERNVLRETTNASQRTWRRRGGGSSSGSSTCSSDASTEKMARHADCSGDATDASSHAAAQQRAQSFRSTRLPYVQMITFTTVPGPWRRIARARLPHVHPHECVVAFVDRQESASEDASEDDKDEKRISYASDTRGCDRNHSNHNHNHNHKKKKHENEDSGFYRPDAHNDDDDNGEELVLAGRCDTQTVRRMRTRCDASMTSAAAELIQRDGSRSSISRSRNSPARCDAPSDETCSTNEVCAVCPVKESDAAVARAHRAVYRRYLTVCSGQAAFEYKDRVADDPLLRIPRIDVDGNRRGRSKRGWLERLLATSASSQSMAFSQLYMSHEEDIDDGNYEN